jgi:hypothetical protein
MPTVQQILKDSGFTDEEIAGLQPKAITAFSSVLSQAEAERQANARFYDESIVPSLTSWEEEKTRYDANNARIAAENAYYKAQAEAAGLVFTDPPGHQGRDPQGRYVAGGGGTPGSPTFVGGNGNGGVDMNAIDQRLGTGISNASWAMMEYQRLNPGQFLPDSFDKLAQEATVARLPFRDFVERKYQFAEKRAEAEKKRQEDHDNAIRRETEQRVAREYSERTGSNPDVRRPQDSRFADIQRARAANTIPDPLSLNEEQRRMATRQMIREDISKTSES